MKCIYKNDSIDAMIAASLLSSIHKSDYIKINKDDIITKDMFDYSERVYLIGIPLKDNLNTLMYRERSDNDDTLFTKLIYHAGDTVYFDNINCEKIKGNQCEGMSLSALTYMYINDDINKVSKCPYYIRLLDRYYRWNYPIDNRSKYFINALKSMDVNPVSKDLKKLNSIFYVNKLIRIGKKIKNFKTVKYISDNINNIPCLVTEGDINTLKLMKLSERSKLFPLLCSYTYNEDTKKYEYIVTSNHKSVNYKTITKKYNSKGTRRHVTFETNKLIFKKENK